jgi:hypothetical protein
MSLLGSMRFEPLLTKSKVRPVDRVSGNVRSSTFRRSHHVVLYKYKAGRVLGHRITMTSGNGEVPASGSNSLIKAARLGAGGKELPELYK